MMEKRLILTLAKKMRTFGLAMALAASNVPVSQLPAEAAGGVMRSQPSIFDTQKGRCGSPSNGETDFPATLSNAIMVAAGDIWIGLTMSDHLDGEGTKQTPYLIQSANDLRYLAYHTANDTVNGYQGVYFRLTKDITLGSNASWLPIGYFRTLGDPDPVPFKGFFDGNGKTISNLQINNVTQSFAGLFGSTQGATIKDLKVTAKIAALDKAGAIIGEANDTVILRCESSGSVRANGVLGGVVGEAYDSYIQDCTNRAQVTGGVAAPGLDVYAGGITGAAHNSKISDCISDTTDSSSTIYSENAVGGIAGNLEASKVYNCYVEGKVGSSSAKIIGGLVGRMLSGEVKVNRFAGTIGASASGALQEAGLFIGHIETCTTELGDHISHLYCNSEDKFSLNPFGNALNGLIRMEHHIGAYSADNRECSLFSPVASPRFNKLTNMYFYEELESGVLSLADGEVHHWAVGKTGDPVPGYLVTVEDIDHGTLSVQEAQNTYAKEINFANPGAIAKGVKVYVHTSPINDMTDPPVYYELEEDSLRWFTPGTDRYQIIGRGSSELSFTMPQDQIQVTAQYRALTNGVTLDQRELTFEVKQIRTGSRWEPTVAWQVSDPRQLRATVIPESAANKNVYWNVKDTDGSSTDSITVTDNGTVSVNKDAKWISDRIGAAVNNQLTLYPSKKITLQDSNFATATVTTEAGQKRAGCTVRINLSVEDQTYVPVDSVQLNQSEITFEVERRLTENRLTPQISYKVTPGRRLNATIFPEYSDNKKVSWEAGDKDMVSVDADGMVTVNPSARWIEDLIAADTEKKEQDCYAESTAAGNQSTYIMAATVDGGKQAVCAVNIRFKTVDDTRIYVEGISLDRKELEFNITRTLNGDRLKPEVNCDMTPPQLLTATVTPSVAFNKKENWEASDGNVLTVGRGGTVEANGDAAWIQNLLREDEKQSQQNPYAVSTASGEKRAFVTVRTEDGDYKDTCEVILHFQTIDNTVVHAESIRLDQETLDFEIEMIKTGRRGNPTITCQVSDARGIKAEVLPSQTWDKEVLWSADSDAIIIQPDDNGCTVTADPDATWIQDLIVKRRTSGSWEAKVEGMTKDGGHKGSCKVNIVFKVTDRTTGSSGGGGGSSGSGGGGISSGADGNAALGGGINDGPGQTAMPGNWGRDALTQKWRYQKSDGSYAKNIWAQLPYNDKQEWYFFNEQGEMETGWHTDQDGFTYFLHDIADGNQGRMYTGWNLIDGKWYYFNEISNGVKGSLLKNTMTPDGYKVGKDGVWLP